MEQLAIVILNWNGASMLAKYLPSVLKYAEGVATVYVADNASDDESLQLLAEKFPSCKTIVLEKNWGFAQGYNEALKKVTARYYLLLNSDIEVTEGWLQPLLDFMEAHPEVAACQPKIRSIAHRDSFEYAGACGGYIDRLGYPYCRGRVFENVEKDSGQYDQEAEILWASGAALLIRGTDYWRVGGLDGRFFAHNEEIDLCWRLRIMGRKIYCVPASCVYHVGGGTLPKKNPMKTYLNFRNNLTMLYKCLPEKDLNHVMRVRWFLDYVAAWKMLLVDGHPRDFWAVFRARHAFRRWKHQFDEDRRQIQHNRHNEEERLTSPFSLLWQYHFGRKRTYAALNA